ncbi:MAG TPA: zinc ABC transporter substrate-binding protein [Termitinemataceae bacterium]|nr:zinc ABC transporter substrate-binding protein [Termitinemataceae bacterium]HOM24033.1 zinc ABC transporter substrate-binding protein [Termitinemataceae bacterium]HPQ00965.1 zinc ABC transporter substrate-binding protein [Termitinemataceae bacterium]
MRYQKIPLLFLALLAGVMLTGCGGKQTKSDKPVVVVSILPHRYFLERIGGDTIQSLVLVGPGQSPHSYEPTPQQMEQLGRARAWIYSNTDFEITLLPRIKKLFPQLKLVDGTAGMKFRSLEAHEHEEEEHDIHEEDSHEEQDEVSSGAEGMEVDRHTWLGKEGALVFSRHVVETLSELFPAYRSQYEERYHALIQEIEQVFAELRQQLESLAGSKVYVFHPAFGYFLDEFKLQQVAVETGGKEPSPQALAALIKQAQQDKPRVIFVQAQFPTASAEALAKSIDAVVLPLDPLAPDWLLNIKKMGAALSESLKRENLK